MNHRSGRTDSGVGPAPVSFDVVQMDVMAISAVSELIMSRARCTAEATKRTDETLDEAGFAVRWGLDDPRMRCSIVSPIRQMLLLVSTQSNLFRQVGNATIAHRRPGRSGFGQRDGFARGSGG